MKQLAAESLADLSWFDYEKVFSLLTGAIVEADFDAAAVGQGTRTIRLVLEGKEAARTTVDFSRLE